MQTHRKALGQSHQTFIYGARFNSSATVAAAKEKHMEFTLLSNHQLSLVLLKLAWYFEWSIE